MPIPSADTIPLLQLLSQLQSLEANMGDTNNTLLQGNKAQVTREAVTLAVTRALESLGFAKHGPWAQTMVAPRVSNDFTPQATHQSQIEHNDVRNFVLL